MTNPIVELCAKVCEKRAEGWGNVPKDKFSVEYGKKQECELLAAAIRAIPESEIAAVAGEPVAIIYEWDTQRGAVHRSLVYEEYNGAFPDRAIEVYAAPAAPEGMKLVPMDSTDCIICKKKANPWTARIVPEKGLICASCCDLQDAQETMPSVPAVPEGMVMELTEEMIDAPRYLLLYAETPGRTIEGAREHMRLSGCSIECWPEWAKKDAGHLTKAGLAILIWHMMLAAAKAKP